MKTKRDIIEAGYPKDWATKCSKCSSWDCHAYKDIVFCFDCKNKEVAQ